jgi:hypothetical protein
MPAGEHCRAGLKRTGNAPPGLVVNCRRELARMLRKKQRIFKKTIRNSFPHFPQICRDAVNREASSRENIYMDSNYGALHEVSSPATGSFFEKHPDGRVGFGLTPYCGR